MVANVKGIAVPRLGIGRMTGSYTAYGYAAAFLPSGVALYSGVTRWTFDRNRPEGSFALRCEVAADESAFARGGE